MFRKLLTVAVLMLTVGVANATNLNWVKLLTGGVSYSIDADTCEPTIHSRRLIRKVIVKDSDGDVVRKWRRVFRRSFRDFEPGTIAMLAQGTVTVKYGWLGSVQLGEGFRDELQACLAPACPFEDLLVSTIAEAGGGDSVGSPEECYFRVPDEIDPDAFYGVGVKRFTVESGEDPRETGFGGIDVIPSGFVGDLPTCDPDGVRLDGTLESFEEAKACEAVLGCDMLTKQ